MIGYFFMKKPWTNDSNKRPRKHPGSYNMPFIRFSQPKIDNQRGMQKRSAQNKPTKKSPSLSIFPLS
jgi:hypothetical protein